MLNARYALLLRIIPEGGFSIHELTCHKTTLFNTKYSQTNYAYSVSIYLSVSPCIYLYEAKLTLNNSEKAHYFILQNPILSHFYLSAMTILYTILYLFKTCAQQFWTWNKKSAKSNNLYKKYVRNLKIFSSRVNRNIRKGKTPVKIKILISFCLVSSAGCPKKSPLTS